MAILGISSMPGADLFLSFLIKLLISLGDVRNDFGVFVRLLMMDFFTLAEICWLKDLLPRLGASSWILA